MDQYQKKQATPYPMQCYMPNMCYGYPMMGMPQMCMGAPQMMMKAPVQIPEEDIDGMDEMDMEYMEKMYPDVCKKILVYVKVECDSMEYEGSCMYDEYPEKEALDMIIDNIYEKMKKDNACNLPKEKKMQRQYYDYNRLYRGLIGSLLFNEMFGRRRRRYRRRRRRYPSCYGGYCYDYYYPYY